VFSCRPMKTPLGPSPKKAIGPNREAGALWGLFRKRKKTFPRVLARGRRGRASVLGPRTRIICGGRLRRKSSICAHNLSQPWETEAIAHGPTAFWCSDRDDGERRHQLVGRKTISPRRDLRSCKRVRAPSWCGFRPTKDPEPETIFGRSKRLRNGWSRIGSPHVMGWLA